jgi:hypothetical protein
MDGGFISANTWRRFVSLKARRHLVQVFEMEDVAWAFSEEMADTLFWDRLDLDFLEAAADALRSLPGSKTFKRIIPGLDIVFKPALSQGSSPEAASLTSQETTVFRLMNGRRTLGDIASATGFGHEAIYRSCLLLLFLGLVKGSERGAGPSDGFRGNSGGVIALTIEVYLELFRIVEKRFRENAGSEFDRILEGCRSGLSERSRAILEGINLSEGPLKSLPGKLKERWSDRIDAGGGRLFLSGTFNKLLYLLVLRMKETLGRAAAEKILHEMRNFILYAEEVRGRREILDYVRRNIEDYLLRLGS